MGGLIADKTRNYKGTILTGLVIMAAGYLLIAIPTPTPVRNLPLYLTVTCIGLFTIAFGNRSVQRKSSGARRTDVR